jgi:hypothetical protein
VNHLLCIWHTLACFCCQLVCIHVACITASSITLITRKLGRAHDAACLLLLPFKVRTVFTHMLLYVDMSCAQVVCVLNSVEIVVCSFFLACFVSRLMVGCFGTVFSSKLVFIALCWHHFALLVMYQFCMCVARASTLQHCPTVLCGQGHMPITGVWWFCVFVRRLVACLHAQHSC